MPQANEASVTSSQGVDIVDLCTPEPTDNGASQKDIFSNRTAPIDPTPGPRSSRKVLSSREASSFTYRTLSGAPGCQL